MELIFIHGPAAVGKLTVARELSRQAGLRLFHNHLVVDAVLAVFDFGSAPFVRLRESMWLGVFAEAARAGTSLIFTFAPEATVRPAFVGEAVRVVEEAGGRVSFVKLICTVKEQERRIEDESRAEFRKLRSLELLRHLRDQGSDQYPALPDSGLTLDTTATTPAETARRIREFFSLPAAPGG